MKYWILTQLQEMANDFLQEAWIDQVMLYALIPHITYMIRGVWF